MTLHSRNRAGRSGFTLIELLVVIAIIAILVGLTAVAVFRVFVGGDRTKARRDISELSAAVTAFKQEFEGVDYIPSRIRLYERNPWPQNDQLDIDSRNYIKKMFPGIDLDNPLPAGQFFDWNGDGIQNGPHVLEGHYCLVFFLGGIPDSANNGLKRFSTINRNPTLNGGERKGREFEFQAKQLVRGYNGFFYYVDPWGTPYAFFSAYGKTNRYSKYGSSDCASLGISPYMKNTTDYWKSDSFQIISAGVDKKFGPGGLWTPNNGGAGTDDNMSNFHDGLMK